MEWFIQAVKRPRMSQVQLARLLTTDAQGF